MTWNQLLVGARHDGHQRGNYGERERREREWERRERRRGDYNYDGVPDYAEFDGGEYDGGERTDPAWLRYQAELAAWRARFGYQGPAGGHHLPIPSPGSRPGFHWVPGPQGGHWARDRAPRIGAGHGGGGHGGHGGGHWGGGHHGGHHGGWRGRGGYGWGGYGYGGYPYGYAYGYPYAYPAYGTEVALGPVAGPWVRRATGLM